MSRFAKNRSMVLGPALLIAISALPGVFRAQSSQAPAASSIVQPATEPATPAKAPTPEQTGDALAGHQRYQAAIAAYSKALEKTATIWNKMGISYQMMLNAHEAMRCYRESLKLDPRNPQVLNNLGTVYASMKEYGQADRLYRKAIKLDPKDAPILKNLGTNLLEEKKYTKGWAAYQQAIAIDPEIFANHDSLRVENPASVEERGAMNYYMALGCARSGYVDCALQYLRAALDEGFTSRKKIAADAQFASLRGNPDFQHLMAEPSAQ